MATVIAHVEATGSIIVTYTTPDTDLPGLRSADAGHRGELETYTKSVNAHVTEVKQKLPLPATMAAAVARARSEVAALESQARLEVDALGGTILGTHQDVDFQTYWERLLADEPEPATTTTAVCA